MIESFGSKEPSRSINGELLKVGDRICWSLVTSCDECHYCKHSLPQKCSAAIKYGHHVWNGPDDLTGGFSEHCILQPGTRVMRLPYAMPLEIACPISCATATIAAAIEAASIQANDTVLVVGAGLLGLTATAMAKHAGAAQVICLEPNSARRELSMQFGVDHAVDATNLRHVSQQLSSGRGVDCVIECSGSVSAFREAIALTRMGGRIVLVGSVFPGCTVDIDLDQIVRRNLSLIGIHNYAPHHLQQAVAFASIASDVYPFQGLVSDWYPLEDMHDAIHKASTGQSIRVGIKM